MPRWTPINPDFDSFDDESLNLRSDSVKRDGLNDAFADFGRALRESNPEAFRNLRDTMMGTFKLSASSVNSYFSSGTSRSSFVTKGLPRRVFDSSRNEVYKMRVAFAEGAIAGAMSINKITSPNNEKTKVQTINSTSGGSDNKLREYLRNSYIRTQAMRLNFNKQGATVFEYSRYPRYPENEEPSVDLDDWDAAVSEWGWNPDIDLPEVGF